MYFTVKMYAVCIYIYNVPFQVISMRFHVGDDSDGHRVTQSPSQSKLCSLNLEDYAFSSNLNSQLQLGLLVLYSRKDVSAQLETQLRSVPYCATTLRRRKNWDPLKNGHEPNSKLPRNGEVPIFYIL